MRTKILTILLLTCAFAFHTPALNAQCISISRQPSGISTCPGSPVTFSVTAAGASSYQWQASTNGGFTWFNLYNDSQFGNVNNSTLYVRSASPNLDGYKFRCYLRSWCGSTYTNSASLYVYYQPANISSHPTTQTVNEGMNASFFISASGVGPLSYQWQVLPQNGSTWTNLSDVSPYSNTNTSSLKISNASSSMNYNLYRCIVRTGCGISNTSNSAYLVVNSVPVSISANPLDQTVCPNASASFSVTANGSTLSYQWQISTDNASTWNNQADGGGYSGMTTPTMTISNASLSMKNYKYRCLVSNSNSSATSTSATLNIIYVSITGQPQTQMALDGNSAAFSFSLNSYGQSFQWEEYNGTQWVSLTNGGIYSNVNTPGLIINPVSPSMNHYQYRCRVYSSCGSCYTNTVYLLVSTLFIVSQPTDQTICSATPATFSVGAISTAPITYQWQIFPANGSSWVNQSDGGIYSGMTTSTMQISQVDMNMKGDRYRCIVSNGTISETSYQAYIFIKDPIITFQPIDRNVVNGSEACFTFRYQRDGYVQMQWQEYDGTSWNNLTSDYPYSGTNSDSLHIVDIPLTKNNYQYKCQVYNECGSVFTNAATLTVSQLKSAPWTDLGSEKENSVIIYPNPAKDRVTVTLASDKSSQTIQITDMNGAILYEGVINPETESYELSTRNLAAGSYIIRIINGKETKVNKLIIE